MSRIGWHKRKIIWQSIVGALLLIVATIALLGQHVAAATTSATWTSTTTIATADGTVYTDSGVESVTGPLGSVAGGAKEYFFTAANTDGSCSSYIYFPTNANLDKVTTAKLVKGNQVVGKTSGCTYSGADTVTLTNTKANPDSTAGGGDGSAPTEDACNTSGNPITWVLCPVFDGFAGLSDSMLNVVQDFLKTSPISTSSSDPVYKIWSSFRVYGDIFLVIALLVIVFGQSIGGGIVDAYTAKKVLPRLLIAAILINLSIYIVALLVDATNIIGQSVGNIITAPLNGVSLSPSGWKLGIFAALTGGAAAAATIVALLNATATLALAASAVSAFLPFLLLFVVGPAFLAIALVFITLVLRKAIILALVLVSPVAFALYCLPNTEQYFRKWWKLLQDMLLIYPIVMIIFAVSDVLAYTVIQENGTSSFWAYFIAFLLQFVPLFMIPYAFKLGSNALGSMHDVMTNYRKRGQEAVKGNVNDPWSRRNRAKRAASNQILAGREGLVAKGVSLQKAGGRGRLLGGLLARTAGMGNYEELRSRRNREAAEMHQGQVATGADNTSRALFARKLKYMHDTGEKDADGNAVLEQREGWFGTGTQVDDNGIAIGKSAPQFAPSEVSKARSLYGSNPSLYQAALTYELGKASNDDELDTTLAVHQSNMSGRNSLDASREGVWAGSKFAMQGTRRELKHTSEGEGGVGYVRNSAAFTQEVAQNIGSYPLSNMRTSTIKALSEDHAAATDYLRNSEIAENTSGTYSPEQVAQARQALSVHASKQSASGQTKTQISSRPEAEAIIRHTTATAESLQSRRTMGGQAGVVSVDGETQVPGAQSGAPGYVDKEMGKFVEQVLGPQQPPPTRPTSGDGGGRPSGGGSGGSGLVLPGQPGFNIPPGSRPPGP